MELIMANVPPSQANVQSQAALPRWRGRNCAVVTGQEDNHRKNGGDDGEIGVATKTRPKTKRPSLYRVLILNDDYTPMEFVVTVLQSIFNKSSEAAWEITMHVHKHGVGECGVFPFEIAETKVTVVLESARKHQYPLQCVMEKQ